MERESFEDEATAEQLNRDFVAIKVDREERPDLDDVYMAAVQALTGSGGWPMSVFLTPELEPFFGGTYFPPDDRHGLPAFRRVLDGVADAYRNRRAEVVAQGAQLARHLRESVAIPAGQQDPGVEMLDRAAAAAGRELRRRARRLWRSAQVPRADDPGVPAAHLAANRRRRPAGHGDAAPWTAWPTAASTTSSAAASPATAPMSAGWCRTSRRCCTTTRSWRTPTSRRIGPPAQSATRRSRSRPSTSCSASSGPMRAAWPPHSMPTARARRAASTSGRPTRWRGSCPTPAWTPSRPMR